MKKELWFAKIHITHEDEAVLKCATVKVIRETPKRWYIESEDNGLIGYCSYVNRDSNQTSGFSINSFYADTEIEVLNLALESFSKRTKCAEAKAAAMTKALKTLEEYVSGKENKLDT